MHQHNFKSFLISLIFSDRVKLEAGLSDFHKNVTDSGKSAISLK